MLDLAVKLQMLQERYKSNAEQGYVSALKDAHERIVGKLASTDGTDQIKRLKAIRALIEDEIGQLYESVKPDLKDDMQGFAELEHKTLFNYMNETNGLGYAFVALPKDTIKEVLDFDAVIPMGDKGYSVNDFFDTASQSHINRYKQIIAGGLDSNDGYRAITKRLKEADAKGTMDLGSIVHTAISAARDRANVKTYESFDDVIIGWKSIGTLDSRISAVCASLESVTYMKPKFKRYEDIPNRPPRHFNCLLGDTLISSRYPISYISMRKYQGAIYTIVTASGNNIRCTPNHPILTNRGFVNANGINKTDKIVTDAIGQGIRFTDSQDDNGVSTIENLFNSVIESFGVMPVKMPLTPEDFHNDSFDDEVSVVLIDRDLLLKSNAIFSEKISNSGFVSADVSNTSLSTFGLLNKNIMRYLNSSSSFMTRFNLAKSLLLGHKRPLHSFLLGLVSKFDSLSLKLGLKLHNWNINSFGKSSNTNTIVIESNSTLKNKNSMSPLFSVLGDTTLTDNNPLDDTLSDSVLAMDILNGTIGDKVFLDDIIDIFITEMDTHVYNLENDLGYYTANNLITHNCRSIIRSLTKLDEEGLRPQNGDTKSQISSNTKFPDWFANQSKDFQRKWLGDGRYQLYKDGRLSINNFVDVKSGRLFTLDELESML
jgi:hypothetical protein